MIFLFCDTDGLVPLVHFLVHLHGFFSFVGLQQDGFRLVLVFLQHGDLRFHHELRGRVLAGLLRLLLSHLVDFRQISGFGHIAQCCLTPLRHLQFSHFQGHLRQRLPVSFCFWSDVQRLQNLHRSAQILCLQSLTELDQRLIQGLTDVLDSIVYYDFSLAFRALNLDHVSFDGVYRDFVRVIDVVPDAQVGPVLRYHHI